MKLIATIIAFFLISITNVYTQQIFDYSIDGLTSDFSTCETGTMEVKCSTTYQGSPNIVWTIYKGADIIATTTVKPPVKVNGTNTLKISIPRVHGSYRVERKFKNIGSTTYGSSYITVSAVIGGISGPAFTINNALFATGPLEVYNVSSAGAINLDGTSVSCTYKAKFFVSIQLSDINFGRYNNEASAWFNSASNSYGSLSSFNLKTFAQQKSFVFYPGQYYRVKIAYGSPWEEFTRLIKVN